MRPEIGRVLGVATWANGGPFCTIVCTRGHKKRLIDRIRWVTEEDRGDLYTAAFRLDDLFGVDPGTSAEDSPRDSETKWRLRCPCGLDVVLNWGTLNRLADGTMKAGIAQVELGALAAIIGSSNPKG